MTSSTNTRDEQHTAASAPRVTIGLPVYNGDQFLAEAIESVLAQTYEGWELLLVDAGSTDGSSEVSAAYAARCPARIRYLSHGSRRTLG